MDLAQKMKEILSLMKLGKGLTSRHKEMKLDPSFGGLVHKINHFIMSKFLSQAEHAINLSNEIHIT